MEEFKLEVFETAQRRPSKHLGRDGPLYCSLKEEKNGIFYTHLQQQKCLQTILIYSTA